MMLTKILKPLCSPEVRMLLERMELSPREIIDGHDGWHEFIYRSGEHYRKFTWIEQVAIDSMKDAAKDAVLIQDRQAAYKAITVRALAGADTEVKDGTSEETVQRLKDELRILKLKHAQEISQYDQYIKHLAAQHKQDLRRVSTMAREHHTQ